MPRSLRSVYPGRWWIPGLLAVTAACLLAGQVLPGVTLESIGREPEQYSVMGGVIDLWRTSNPILAVVLFCFSIIFPTVKLIALAWMWFSPIPAERRALVGHWLKALGKWSMLDTFVVAALIGSVQLSKVVTAATAYAEPAVYFFATAILLSIYLSFVIGALAERESGERHLPDRMDLTMLFAPWLALSFISAGVRQPLLLIEKKVFENHYELLDSIEKLFDSKEYFLSLVLVIFAVALPIAYFSCLGILMNLHRAGRKVSRELALLVKLERWSMIDVYFLGLLLVYSKVANIATVTRMSGFWFLAGAAALSIYCSFRLRHVR